ncbi:hypothetical protein [Natronorubrum texcoconense]|uniref:hypothetical protein n=1 Tax=Natronorubrum texcoconense TaxID=1095776 RepID=UPI0011143953|nr:hypothetical protein [Natronorubrum texcoconense]
METLLVVLFSFSGGLAAVVLSQILDIYRQDIENLRRLSLPFRRLRLLIKGEIPHHLRDKALEEISNDIEEVYIEYGYLLSDESESWVVGSLWNIDKLVDRDPNQVVLGQSYREEDIDPDDIVEKLSEELSENSDKFLSRDFQSETSKTYLLGASREFENTLCRVTLRGAVRRYLGKSNPYC